MVLGGKHPREGEDPYNHKLRHSKRRRSGDHGAMPKQSDSSYQPPNVEDEDGNAGPEQSDNNYLPPSVKGEHEKAVHERGSHRKSDNQPSSVGDQDENAGRENASYGSNQCPRLQGEHDYTSPVNNPPRRSPPKKDGPRFANGFKLGVFNGERLRRTAAEEELLQERSRREQLRNHNLDQIGQQRVRDEGNAREGRRPSPQVSFSPNLPLAHSYVDPLLSLGVESSKVGQQKSHFKTFVFTEYDGKQFDPPPPKARVAKPPPKAWPHQHPTRKYHTYQTEFKAQREQWKKVNTETHRGREEHQGERNEEEESKTCKECEKQRQGMTVEEMHINKIRTDEKMKEEAPLYASVGTAELLQMILTGLSAAVSKCTADVLTYLTPQDAVDPRCDECRAAPETADGAQDASPRATILTSKVFHSIPAVHDALRLRSRLLAINPEAAEAGSSYKFSDIFGRYELEFPSHDHGDFRHIERLGIASKIISLVILLCTIVKLLCAVLPVGITPVSLCKFLNPLRVILMPLSAANAIGHVLSHIVYFICSSATSPASFVLLCLKYLQSAFLLGHAFYYASDWILQLLLIVGSPLLGWLHCRTWPAFKELLQIILLITGLGGKVSLALIDLNVQALALLVRAIMAVARYLFSPSSLVFYKDCILTHPAMHSIPNHCSRILGRKLFWLVLLVVVMICQWEPQPQAVVSRFTAMPPAYYRQ